MKIILKNQALLYDIPGNLREEITANLKFLNPLRLEKERAGRWNRDTPEFLTAYKEIRNKGLLIPRGYMRRLILLCRHHHVPYTIDDQRRAFPEKDFEFRGCLKSFQKEAAEKMLSKEFGTLSAPTGSGKTVMALYMIAQRRQPALVVVHTKELALQWVERIKTFLGIPEKEVGIIGSGKRIIGEKITVALIQSLYKCADEASRHIGYVVVDECHRIPSRTFTEGVTAFDSKYMLGLSATPWRRDQLSVLIFWYLGDIHHEIGSGLLVQTGHILQPEIIVRETGFRPCYDPVTEYSKMLSELTANDERNRLIASDIAAEALENKGVFLVLSDRKKHCETLQSILKYKFRLSADLLTGDLNETRRREVRERLNQGQVKILIATGQLAGEGFDCKALSALFIATPVRFSGRLLQYLGRVLRPAEGKERPRVFDYADIHVGPLKAAALARQKIYTRV